MSTTRSAIDMILDTFESRDRGSDAGILRLSARRLVSDRTCRSEPVTPAFGETIQSDVKFGSERRLSVSS